jgi:hypothetical protein
MRILIALVSTFVVAACSAPSKPIKQNDTGSDVPPECCCKSNPLTSEDGKPVYEKTNRMECSTKQGECVPDVQCKKDIPPVPPG